MHVASPISGQNGERSALETDDVIVFGGSNGRETGAVSMLSDFETESSNSFLHVFCTIKNLAYLFEMEPNRKQQWASSEKLSLRQT